MHENTDKWHERFLQLAKHISSWSRDPSTKVGAVLVDDRRIVVGTGYNGFARGVDDSEERYNDRPLKYKLVVHAEVNAILMAGERAKGGILYVYPAIVTPPLCHDCAKFAIQAGIKEVVGYTPVENEELQARWADSIAISRMMFDECGITYRSVKNDG